MNNVRCINVHPGYIPINRGWYPQVFAINYNLPIGATIHEMDDKLDNGKIIARKFVKINSWDTSLEVYNRVLEVEVELFKNNINNILTGNYELLEPESNGNIFYKMDFKELCRLDFNEEGNFLKFYNRLRALSHGKFRNAYFIDEKSGSKVYIRLDVELDQ